MLGRLLNPERRALSYQSVWGAGGDWNAATTWSGERVSYETAFMLSTTYGCVRLISDTISTFPADTFFRRDGQRLPFRPKPAWVLEPSLSVSMIDHIQQVVVSMLLAHGACVRVYRNDVGEVVAVQALDPTLVEPVTNKATGAVDFSWNNGESIIPARDMLYIPMLRRPGRIKGVSPLDELKNVFGSAAALDKFASSFFSNGSVTSGILELPQQVTKDQAGQIKEVFEAGHRGLGKSHRVGVIGGGGKFVKTGVDPEQAQMLQSRQMATEEIARIFRVPLHMLQVAAPGVQSYASNEQNAIQFSSYTLRPIVAKIEEAYSRLLPGGAFLRLNMDAILRGDLASRFASYSNGIQAGFLSINDIHRLEDMPPVAGGDTYRVPLANVNITAADLVETDKLTSMAQRLILAGFEPADVLAKLGLPAIAHTGLPSTQLQLAASMNPDDPSSAYPVEG